MNHIRHEHLSFNDRHKMSLFYRRGTQQNRYTTKPPRTSYSTAPLKPPTVALTTITADPLSLVSILHDDHLCLWYWDLRCSPFHMRAVFYFSRIAPLYIHDHPLNCRRRDENMRKQEQVTRPSVRSKRITQVGGVIPHQLQL